MIEQLPPDFDPRVYLQLNEDVMRAGADPGDHYLRYGYAEGRDYRRSTLSTWGKAHLLGVFSAARGLKSYLEISTTSTGGKYGAALELGFERAERIVYRMPEGSQMWDGFPVTYSTAADDITGIVDRMIDRAQRFDLIFVDAHHTYECSLRDIRAALRLLSPGGVIMLHDCNPLNPAVASSEYREGSWMGVTYQAYLDVCLENPAFDYFTIDADFGCGVIMRPRTIFDALRNKARATRQRYLGGQWREQSHSADAAFKFFQSHRADLLRLGDFRLLRYKLKK